MMMDSPGDISRLFMSCTVPDCCRNYVVFSVHLSVTLVTSL